MFASNQPGPSEEVCFSSADYFDFNNGRGHFKPQTNAYGNTYNEKWRNHPGFSYKNNSGPSGYNQGQSFNHQNQGRREDQEVNQKLDKLMEMMEEGFRRTEINTKSISALEKQVGQIAEQLNKRPQGVLPSTTQVNPQHARQGNIAQVNQISVLRSGKAYNDTVHKPTPHDDEVLVEDYVSDEDEESNKTMETKKPEKNQNVYKPEIEEGSNTVPYPMALNKPASLSKEKSNSHNEDIWETFKQVKINLPLIDAIKQIPVYAKFLKDLCTHKRRHKIPKKLDLNANVSAALTCALPPKLQDPGAPLISIEIGNIKIKRALLDLGASVNVLPGSLYDKFDLGPLQKTNVIVTLADSSLKQPRGVLNDVIVKVEDFYYPVDFLVLDDKFHHKDQQPNVILGRPFLATINAQISCREGSIDVTFGNRKLKLHAFKTVPDVSDEDECFMINTNNQKHALRGPSDNTEEQVHSFDRRNTPQSPLAKMDEPYTPEKGRPLQPQSQDPGPSNSKPPWRPSFESPPFPRYESQRTKGGDLFVETIPHDTKQETTNLPQAPYVYNHR